MLRALLSSQNLQGKMALGLLGAHWDLALSYLDSLLGSEYSGCCFGLLGFPGTIKVRNGRAR